jgi:hypothetical protein
MSCDHLVCRALGASCLLAYGDAPEGVFDQDHDSPPKPMLDQLEHELAAIDLDALRLAVRAEEARRACRSLVEGLVQHELYELSHTHDRDARARRETKLLARIKALKI